MRTACSAASAIITGRTRRRAPTTPSMVWPRIWWGCLAGAATHRRFNGSAGRADPHLAGAALLPPFRAAAAEVRRNWTAAALATTYATPMGAISGAGLASYTVVEIVVHSWDLAVATDQAIRPTDSLATLVLGLASEFDEATLRAPGMMAPAVDVPAEAPAMDRLVAFLGRDPYAPIKPPL